LWQLSNKSERERNSSLFLFLVLDLAGYMSIIEQIIALLDKKFEEEDFNDCFLVEAHHNNSKLELFIDSDSNITFTKCRKISRYLESFIDENGWLGEKYTLDVSSPGITRPLKFKRQYVKNIGRKMEIKLKEEGAGTNSNYYKL